MKSIKGPVCIAAALAFGACAFAGCKPDEPVIPDGPDDGGKDPIKAVATYLRTDKSVYCADEDVYITAGGGEDSWVGVFPRGGALEESEAVISYGVNKDGMYSGRRKVIDVMTELSNGEYRAVLFGGEGVAEVKEQTEFSVVEHGIFTDKNEYYTDEEIVVTCYGGDGAWVGLYKADEQPQDTQSICWYYLQKNTHLVGQSYILQRTGEYNRNEYRTLPAGDYKLVLFSNDSTSSIIEEKEITVKDGTTAAAVAPSKGSFKADDAESGFAGGEVTLEFDKNACVSEAVAYWADAEGELYGYAPFAEQRVSSNPLKYNLPDKLYVPEGAKSLRVYGKNFKGVSEDYLDIPLNLQASEKGKLLYTFNVISDIHISTLFGGAHNGKTVYNDNFRNACLDITDNNPDSAMTVIVGDIANEGRSEEWALADKIIKETGAPEAFYTLGNHDLYAVTEPYDEKIDDFLRYSGQADRGETKVYYEKEVEGIHHLALGSQEQHVSGGVESSLHADQLQWLETRLEEITTKNPSRPVFLYSHQSTYDTIAGSLKGHNWNGIRPDEKLKSILAKYPQVLFFNGHSHWLMNSYRNAYFASDKMPNVFNTASVAYLWSTTDKEVEVAGSQGYYVSVYKDRVVVKGRDFSAKKWLPSACYTVKNV